MPSRTPALPDNTPAKVLKAAGQVFAERGFQNATVREICGRAGVNLASVNYHFRDKETLYVEAVKQAHRDMAEQFPMPQWQPATSPQERLRGFIQTMLSRLLTTAVQPWQNQLMMREVLQPTTACRELVETFFRPHFTLLCGILTELTPRGTPEHRLHQIALSIVGQCLHHKLGREVDALLLSAEERARYFTVEELTDHITRFSLSGLKYEARRS